MEWSYVKRPALCTAQELQLASLPKRSWHIVGCSAVSSEGLLGGFDWIVGDVSSRIYMLT